MKEEKYYTIKDEKANADFKVSDIEKVNMTTFDCSAATYSDSVDVNSALTDENCKYTVDTSAFSK